MKRSRSYATVSRANRWFATHMLASGVIAGIAAGVAFGGDWRRLSKFTLRFWPLLVVASGFRLLTVFFPQVSLLIYLLGFIGVGLVAVANWRLPGSSLIA